jgi:hypothetical protein
MVVFNFFELIDQAMDKPGSNISQLNQMMNTIPLPLQNIEMLQIIFRVFSNLL